MPVYKFNFQHPEFAGFQKKGRQLKIGEKKRKTNAFLKK